MQLNISHTTTYVYTEPVPYSLVELRLTPKTFGEQTVDSWNTEITGGESQVVFDDQHDNAVELVRLDDEMMQIVVVASGEVTTTETAGISSTAPGSAPTWLYLRSTDLTAPGSAAKNLVKGLDTETPDVSVLHELSERVAEAVSYQTGSSTVEATVEMVLDEGVGVCQDHAHVFSAAARLLGYPTRYVSGYLLLDDMVAQEAMHAWAESWVRGLGWVGFDVSNRICPDERHVRLATGLDYSDAAPVSGIRFGSGAEQMHVDVQVEAQSQSQSQSQKQQ